MAAGAMLVLIASLQKSLALFIVGFISLFVLSGVGNGSTYKMIPPSSDAEARRRVAVGEDEAEATHRAQRSTRALIGFAGAVGAFGGVLVNLAFRQSFLTYRSGDGALVVGNGGPLRTIWPSVRPTFMATQPWSSCSATPS
jgi:NNP family nitrate/nitrite transporter-like MFS transporter